ncbi:MAG: sphingomyelin synthase family protein [Bacteroidota bacterium]|nr:sphingomyelin synthase family protein [Bacteroidota bacterium]
MFSFNQYCKSSKDNWQQYWPNKNFRYKLITAIFLIGIIIIFAPSFFQSIEQKHGTAVNDIILNFITPHDVSIPIFLFIWSSFFLMFLTVIKHPFIFLTFAIAYIIMCALRYLTISLLPLQPPQGIIILIDPLSNTFYGGIFITKDLFFSGHTATLFLMYLCHKRNVLKYYSLIASISVGILVLVQHIHYSFDVFFAFPFAYISYKIAKYLAYKNF